MKLQTITGVISRKDNDFWLNNLLVKRSGNYDTLDKLLIKLVGYEIEASGLIYNNVFFLHSYIFKKESACQ